MKGIYLATLVYKNCVGKNEYIFNVLGPMLGTLNDKKDIFINTHDRKYYEMNDSRLIKSSNRYGFYNLQELNEEPQNLNNKLYLEKLIKKYYEKYQGISYYIFYPNFENQFIIAFDKKTLKRIPLETNKVATKLY